MKVKAYRNKSGVAIICPFCGEIHVHGPMLGPRVPHCYTARFRNNRYYITEIIEGPIPSELKKQAKKQRRDRIKYSLNTGV